MYTATTGRTRPVIDRRNNRAVRDIARLRARRAARLAAESAAGRRRMVITGVCALSTVILGIVIAATSIAWAAGQSTPRRSPLSLPRCRPPASRLSARSAPPSARLSC